MMYLKHIPKILSLILVIFLGGILVAHAYVPLAPLPIGEGGAIPMGEDASGKLVPMYADMGTYLAGMLKLIIALGGVIAIVMAIYGGIARIASGISPSAKADADKRITDALVGLALVLTSYLILNSINPNLVAINFNLKPITLERRLQELPSRLTEEQSTDACKKALGNFLLYEGTNDPCSGPYNYSQIGDITASSTKTQTILYSNTLNREECEGSAKARYKEKYIGVIMRENGVCSVVMRK